MNDKAIVLLTALTVLLIALTPFHTRAQSTSNQQTPGSNTSGPRIKIAWAGMQARQLQKKLPGYPEEAKDKAIQGRVRLSILVGKDGKVEEVRLLSGDPALGNPAADEVRQWQFQPISLNGQALGGRPLTVNEARPPRTGSSGPRGGGRRDSRGGFNRQRRDW